MSTAELCIPNNTEFNAYIQHWLWSFLKQQVALNYSQYTRRYPSNESKCSWSQVYSPPGISDRSQTGAGVSFACGGCASEQTEARWTNVWNTRRPGAPACPRHGSTALRFHQPGQARALLSTFLRWSWVVVGPAAQFWLLSAVRCWPGRCTRLGRLRIWAGWTRTSRSRSYAEAWCGHRSWLCSRRLLECRCLRLWSRQPLYIQIRNVEEDWNQFKNLEWLSIFIFTVFSKI